MSFDGVKNFLKVGNIRKVGGFVANRRVTSAQGIAAESPQRGTSEDL